MSGAGAQTRILGIAGSLREGSYNAALLRAAAALAPDGVAIEVAGIRGIPLYDGDVEEKSGLPEAVSALKERVVAADGLLLVTPEYNNSIPGAFKNAIDWLSRPASDIPRVFGDRPTALLGATPGGFGTLLSQTAWLQVLRTLRARLWLGGGTFLVSRANKVFGDDGELVDDALRDKLRKFVAGFAEFVRASRASLATPGEGRGGTSPAAPTRS
jgi:NAD(P)H-dependent FMN reductase